MAVPVDPAAADLEALANPAPPSAPVPAVADPVLPAPSAPPAQPAEIFFFFVLVSYLHRFCVVLLCIPGGFFVCLLAYISFLIWFCVFQFMTNLHFLFFLSPFCFGLEFPYD